MHADEASKSKQQTANSKQQTAESVDFILLIAVCCLLFAS